MPSAHTGGATSRSYARQLAAARADLAAIRSLESLAASYARESLHSGGIGRPGSGDRVHRRAVLTAYALRWVELAGASDMPPADDGASAAAFP